MTHLSMPAEWVEEILQEMFRHTPTGVVLADLHGQILEANDAMCSMLGYQPGELTRTDALTLLDEGEVAGASNAITTLRDGEVGSIEAVRPLKHRDGSSVRVRITASVVRSRTGESACALAFVENIEERLRAEEALRASEAAYRQVVENQTEMIVRGRPDGTRLFVNDAYCRFMGRTREELMTESWLPAVYEADLPEVMNGIAAMSPQSPVQVQVHRMVDAAGDVRWHHWTSRGVFDASGALLEVQAVGRDITDEREAQEALGRSEIKFRRLFDALPAASWETDFTKVFPRFEERGIHTPEDLTATVNENPLSFLEFLEAASFVTANPAALMMTQSLGPEGIKPWIFARITPETIRNYVESAAPLLLGDERVVDIELPLRSPDGVRIDLMHRLARLPNWEEEHRLMAITIDVSARRRMERELIRRTQALEKAEELARTGSWEWDPELNLLFGSAGFWRILEGTALPRFASREEVRSFYHPDDRDAVKTWFEALLAKGQSVSDLGADTRILRPDGTALIGRGSAFAMVDEDTKAVRIGGVIQDVTEQRRVERAAQQEREALARADKMIALGTLVAGVAHEINNPNHYIALNAPILRAAWKDLAPIVDAYADANPGLKISNLPWSEMRGEIPSIIDEIALGADRIAAIVSELRRFGRDHDPGVRKPVFLNDVVSGSMRLLANHIRKATANFALDLPPDIPAVLGNAQRLQQVVVNLVLNACQALPTPDKAVRVSTGAENGCVLLKVCDEGIGIQPEDLSKITDPFFTTKRASGGTGLGLAASDRIVKEHGGQLFFDSEPGVGTTATVSIPVMAERES